MNSTFRKEIPIIGIMLMPFVYLAFIWNTLPAKVPTHWNYKGEIDHWGDKFSLIYLLLALLILSYGILFIIPKIDPKKRITLMGGKYYQFKFAFLLVMVILSFFILYVAKNQSFSTPNINFALIGILFVVLGNYFKVIQPNYFIGIRTPWTLENKEIWKLTHAFAGKLWFIGGLLIIVTSLTFSDQFMIYTFASVLGMMVIVPIVYSYIKFKKLEKKEQ
ncbi:SdpI family protein [Flavobacterium aestivum]|uniref:SdpI family protein n=1 Tax=Flavobacterium aestivum TaxID=3003257 RepID=UPI0024827F37|nr:SdpI family protein [Flavobacterium aestivum]